MDREFDELSWDALEYAQKKRSGDWYWTVGIITIAIVVTLFFFNNVLLGLVIAIGVFGLLLYSARAPKEVHFEVNQHGVVIDDTLYPYADLESFWISELGETPKLLLKSKKAVMPLIAIPIADVNPDDVADILIEYIPEVEHEESIAEHMLERLGF